MNFRDAVFETGDQNYDYGFTNMIQFISPLTASHWNGRMASRKMTNSKKCRHKSACADCAG